MEMVIPDEVEPRVAWRAWNLGSELDQPRLLSVNQRTVWQPRVEQTARCLYMDDFNRMRLNCGDPGCPTCGGLEAHAKHSMPACCTCGFYAGKDFTQAESYGQAILGEVNMWGVIHVGASGYRAEKVYPKRLFLVAEPEDEQGWAYGLVMAERLADIYGVPANVVARKALCAIAGVDPAPHGHERWMISSGTWGYGGGITAAPGQMINVTGTNHNHFVNWATTPRIAITGSAGAPPKELEEPDKSEYETLLAAYMAKVKAMNQPQPRPVTVGDMLDRYEKWTFTVPTAIGFPCFMGLPLLIPFFAAYVLGYRLGHRVMAFLWK